MASRRLTQVPPMFRCKLLTFLPSSTLLISDTGLRTQELLKGRSDMSLTHWSSYILCPNVSGAFPRASPPRSISAISFCFILFTSERICLVNVVHHESVNEYFKGSNNSGIQRRDGAGGAKIYLFSSCITSTLPQRFWLRKMRNATYRSFELRNVPFALLPRYSLCWVAVSNCNLFLTCVCS